MPCDREATLESEPAPITDLDCKVNVSVLICKTGPLGNATEGMLAINTNEAQRLMIPENNGCWCFRFSNSAKHAQAFADAVLPYMCTEAGLAPSRTSS